jgi:hypothetical protein
VWWIRCERASSASAIRSARREHPDRGPASCTTRAMHTPHRRLVDLQLGSSRRRRLSSRSGSRSDDGLQRKAAAPARRGVAQRSAGQPATRSAKRFTPGTIVLAFPGPGSASRQHDRTCKKLHTTDLGHWSRERQREAWNLPFALATRSGWPACSAEVSRAVPPKKSLPRAKPSKDGDAEPRG